ncbi:hypothetical protein KVV02_003200 [Mortierella alpina]|uniref:Endonuclease/exonuclease/phosphatase domain-containing protein n=1 Tax=Mortierella alpina TaxID=64518 RepID=A0A9P8CZ06_MORAP|nr:hypothetical protein KVV02_003200 [Mortierella alpina]
MLSVVSYNLLSNTLAQTDSKFDEAVYAPELLDWTARRTRLLDELAGYNSDVVCLQELDKGDYDGVFGARMVALGYGGKVFKKRNTRFEHGMAIFYKLDRVKVIRDCPIPFPQGKVEGVENPGIMLLLEVGAEEQRVCVATTHIPCNDSQGGLRKVGQVMALLSAARALMEKNWSMPFILTGDFNAHLRDAIIKFIRSGSVDLKRIRENKVRAPDSALSEFKAQTQVMRGVFTPSTSVSKADKPEAEMPSEVMKPSKAEELHNMIKSGKDLMDTVVVHVSRLELPDGLAQLKAGLPAVNLGSDHFALGAKFRIADRVIGLGWPGTPDYIGLEDDGKAMVEVDARDRKRYFL